MNYRVVDRETGAIGTMSCEICECSNQAQAPTLGGLESNFGWFEKQIHGFSYPIVVLTDIHMNETRQGNGRRTLRAFHEWIASKGVHFAVLRIGTQGDDYCSGLLWRRRFYASEGWMSLRRPKLPHLVLHWMYRPISESERTSILEAISFAEVDETTEYMQFLT